MKHDSPTDSPDARATLTRRQLLSAMTGALGVSLLAGCKGVPSLAELGGGVGGIRIDSEFGALRTAIVADGSTARDFSLDEQRRIIPAELLAEHPETAASSREKLLLQHEAFCKVLADAGVRLLSAVPQSGAPYQVFIRDPGFAVGDQFFIARMKDSARELETAGLRELRQRFPKVVTFSGANPVIEGGDVVVMDRKRVLVGTNRNTNEAGFLALTAALAPLGIETIHVPHRALHLDCCFAPLPDGTAMVAAAKLPQASLATLKTYYRELHILDPHEAAMHLAANVFWIDRRRVVSGSGAKKTNALLRARGYRVIELDFSQLIALWGSVRCVVCPVERDA